MQDYSASYGTRQIIPSGGGTVTVPIPRVVDASGNGYSGNLYSYYRLWAMGATGTGVNSTAAVSGGMVTAIPASATSITVQQSSTTDIMISFGG